MSAAEQTPFEEIQEQDLQAPEFERDGGDGTVETYEEPAALAEPEANEAGEGLEDNESMGSRPARRRGGRSRGARRGVDASTLPTAESEEEGVFFPGPAEAEEPAAAPESEPTAAPTRTSDEEVRVTQPATPAPRRIYNKDIPDDIEQRIALVAPNESSSSQSAEPSAADRTALIDQAIAEYTQKQNTTTSVDSTERPNLSGKVQAYNVVLGPNSQSKLEHPRSRGEPATVTPETPKPAKAEEPEPAAAPESEPTAAPTRTSDEEVRVTQPAAPATPARRATPSSSGDLYSQLGLAENPLTTDRDELRGASRTGLASTGVPVPNSREIRDGATPEPAATTGEATAEPSAEPRRRRHARDRRETPASFAERVMGYTTGRPAETTPSPNTDNEATQQLPTITIGEATTGEAAPRLSRTQRLRAKLGSVAVAVRDFTKNERERNELRQQGLMPSNPRPGVLPGMSRAERRLEERRQAIEANADSTTDQNFGIANVHIMSPEENAQHERGRGARRRRMVGALGLAAASVGLMAGVSGDMSRDEIPRSSISANQLPGQQSSQESSSIASGAFERANEFIADQVDKAGQARERARELNDDNDSKDKEAQKPSVTDVGNEKITLDNDGGVTIKLERGGNYWEGVQEAERLLDIDDSATATANAVNTIGFEKGEDRNQKVGAQVTFKNINGKLVASRS